MREVTAIYVKGEPVCYAKPAVGSYCYDDFDGEFFCFNKPLRSGKFDDCFYNYNKEGYLYLYCYGMNGNRPLSSTDETGFFIRVGVFYLVLAILFAFCCPLLSSISCIC
jgi:hypothetical protein